MTRARLLAVLAVFVVAVAVAPVAEARSPSSALIQKVNEARKARGLKPLRVSRSLAHSSKRYANRLMRSGYFGHAGRIQASRRFRRLGEVLEMHGGLRAAPSGAFRSWMNSPGHRAVLLDPGFRYIGAGYSAGRFRGRRATIWVMHFGRP